MHAGEPSSITSYEWVRLTLKLDVAVHEPDAVHPRDRFAKLAPYSSDKRLVYPGEAFRIIDKVKQLAAAYMLQNKAVM